MHQNLVPDPFFILANNSKDPLYAINYFKTKILWKGIIKNLLVALQVMNQFTKSSLLVTYYPAKFDGVIQSHFWVISKITSSNLCKPIHDNINYSTFTCPFESRKCGKEEKELQKFEYHKNGKSFLDEKEDIFQFLKGYHLVKKKKKFNRT